VEGVGDDKLRVQDAMRSGIPTCRPSDPVVEVKRRVFDSGWEECLVLDCNRMVVGRLRGRAWDEFGTAADAMEIGPTTVRPDALLRPLVERMSTRNTSLVTVTTPQGTLLGVLMREDSQ
jgi:CBS domain-containing protein